MEYRLSLPTGVTWQMSKTANHGTDQSLQFQSGPSKGSSQYAKHADCLSRGLMSGPFAFYDSSVIT